MRIHENLGWYLGRTSVVAAVQKLEEYRYIPAIDADHCHHTSTAGRAPSDCAGTVWHGNDS